jgi:beta-galactosidase
VFANGYLAPLRDVFGILSEEIDALQTGHRMSICTGLEEKRELYSASDFCELIHLTTAQPIAWYDDEFYAGRPAVTVNKFGQGMAYYVASRNEQRFTNKLINSIVTDLGIEHLAGSLPSGVTRQIRHGSDMEYHFYLNASPEEKTFVSEEWQNIALQPWQVKVFERGYTQNTKEPALLGSGEG